MQGFLLREKALGPPRPRPSLKSQDGCANLNQQAEEMIAAVESQFEAEILRRVASSLNVEL